MKASKFWLRYSSVNICNTKNINKIEQSTTRLLLFGSSHNRDNVIILTISYESTTIILI